MDPTQMLVKISHLIQALLLAVKKVNYHGNNCQTLASCVKMLKPLIGEVQDSKMPIIGGAITSFEGLERVLFKAKELVEKCGGKASRFYVVLRKQRFVMKFQAVSLEIVTYVSSLPLGALQLSDHTQDQVEKCILELRGAIYQIATEEEELAEETEVVLKELREGVKISHEKLAHLASRFELRSNQEILREASLLEKEKDSVRVEKDKQEEEFINQVIILVTQMGDDLGEQKQAQVGLGGIPVPADFRCPLSLELMSDPVIVASGQTYERAYIQQWLDQGNSTCPKTRQTLNHTNLIPNYTVKALIANWCEANKVSFPEPTKLNSLALQPGQVSSLTSTKYGLDDSGHLQELLALTRTNSEHIAPARGSRPPERSMRTINPRVLEDQEADGGRAGMGMDFGSEEGNSEFPQDNSRSVLNGDTDGRCQLTGSRDGDHIADPIHGHSRHTSSSSLASSIDDVQVTAALDENNIEATQGLHDFSPYNSDVSGELQRFSVSSVSGSMQESHLSPARANNRVSVSWRRRGEDPDLNMPRILTSSGTETEDANGNDAQLSVERLIEDLQFNSIDVQRNAATELRLLAKHSVDNRIIIANCGAIRPLVTLLHSTDLQTQENAVTALLNLSINDNNKNEIAAAGAIDPLVNVLRVGNPEAKENSAATLFSLSVMDENKVAIGQSGAIAPLVDLLMHGTPRGKKDAATALFNLSILHANKARIVREGAIRPLVELMSDPASGMVDKAVAVLANLATIQEGRVAIGEAAGIPALVEVVELGSQRGKENAAAALLHLCTNSNRFRAMVLQEGAIPPLVALSQSGTARAREKASALLRHFREQRHAGLGRGGPERHMDHRHFDRPYG